jgi:hypothetical protein
MHIDHRDNAEVAAFLARRNPRAAALAAHDAVPDPYYNCGSHPDIVERLWDQIGAALPVDCRCIVHGSPALLGPASGLILGVCIGTQYGLRMPRGCVVQAIAAGASTVTRWSAGNTMDIAQEFGEDWVFGAWLAQEAEWCRQAFDEAQAAA